MKCCHSFLRISIQVLKNSSLNCECQIGLEQASNVIGQGIVLRKCFFPVLSKDGLQK